MFSMLLVIIPSALNVCLFHWHDLCLNIARTLGYALVPHCNLTLGHLAQTMLIHVEEFKHSSCSLSACGPFRRTVALKVFVSADNM